jgi:hypothetical protein
MIVGLTWPWSVFIAGKTAIRSESSERLARLGGESD